jgi:uncharacterized YccA/Bax inhibitor family protein
MFGGVDRPHETLETRFRAPSARLAMFQANPTIRRLENDGVVTQPLTYNGVIHRTGALLVVTCITFALTWNGLETGQLPPTVAIGGMIAGLVLGLIIALTRITTPLLIVPYAAAEGVLLGAVSYFANQRYPGIALEAVVATLGCFLVVLWLYSIKVLRATPTFVKVISAALFGILALYLVSMISGFFGHSLTFLHDSSPLSIGISVVVIVVAALSFVIDFAAIDEAVAQGVDARHGWRFAFCLLVGLVWLYLELLRLMTKLRGRD